jgi:VIT1/CCC1 family predicted Fe2+/Mn2+ transporter
MVKPFQEKMHLEGGGLIRQIVLGMNDGVVSIFALLAGVAGAGQDATTILITLLAATIAGALSMAAGEFISEKSENDFYRKEIKQERLEVKLIPHIEKQELRLIYQKKGFEGDLLENLVNTITADEDRFIRELVVEELGIAEIAQGEGLLKNTFIIFGAFVLGSLFPVLPYLFFRFLPESTIFWIATIVTFGGLFLVGALKKYVTGMYWLKSGIEMLIVGLFAFGVSYYIGILVGVNV